MKCVLFQKQRNVLKQFCYIDKKVIMILQEVAEEYPGKTIENIIAQMEARKLTIMSQNNK